MIYFSFGGGHKHSDHSNVFRSFTFNYVFNYLIIDIFLFIYTMFVTLLDPLHLIFISFYFYHLFYFWLLWC